MEPLNCTVQMSETGEAGADLYLGTQFAGVDGMAAARVLGLKPEQVRVHVQMAGGGFGRRGVGTSDYVVEADRKSTRLNSSHSQISYAVFCLKKKTERPQR